MRMYRRDGIHELTWVDAVLEPIPSAEAAPLLLLGVRLLKAEGPEGEMEAG